jgi:hypothetical protein
VKETFYESFFQLCSLAAQANVINSITICMPMAGGQKKCFEKQVKSNDYGGK